MKNIKYYISLLFLFLISKSAKAMELTYFDKDIKDIFNDASQFVLSISGGLVLLILIFGGVYYVMSGSNPENQEKAKKIISYALLGLILILSSYAILNAIEKVTVGP
ncbi:MAG: hypothetical protein P1P85_04455 [Patescibacteria group bacterium]|nr:hypothetical protein [Patescibacteria group bacterium]